MAVGMTVVVTVDLNDGGDGDLGGYTTDVNFRFKLVVRECLVAIIFYWVSTCTVHIR